LETQFYATVTNLIICKCRYFGVKHECLGRENFYIYGIWQPTTNLSPIIEQGTAKILLEKRIQDFPV
jgi:hypothetical protein